MPEQMTPRRAIKALLQGETPARPLLLPIIFSLGARLQNLPLRDFQSNPTKVVNALRQIHGVLRLDGVTCSFDPYLELEALGCAREWKADGSSVVTCPKFSDAADLRNKLKAPDTLPDQAPVHRACEVLRRLRALLTDEPALMVGVTGPLALAAQLSGSSDVDLLDFAAEVTGSV